jgi:hypothetical protein
MTKNIDSVETMYFDKEGFQIADRFARESKRTRLSVYIDRNADNHHIEFETKASRYEVAGLLMALADKLTRDI